MSNVPSFSFQNRLEIETFFFFSAASCTQIHGQAEDQQNNSLKYTVQMKTYWEGISFQIILKCSLLLSLFRLACI